MKLLTAQVAALKAEKKTREKQLTAAHAEAVMTILVVKRLAQALAEWDPNERTDVYSCLGRPCSLAICLSLASVPSLSSGVCTTR
eukprot:COSAG05_NODE_2140_length_3487_cov_50.407615_2_plen_85_part_00